MDVTVDGEKEFRLQGEAENVVAALAAIHDYLRARNRALVRLEINGNEIQPGQVEAEYIDTPLDEIESITAESASIPDMVHTCLTELEETVPALPGVCSALAEIFHGEAPEEGFEPFQELAAIWSAIKQRQQLIATAAEIDLNRLETGGETFEAMHKELNTFLEECIEALEAGDNILLGDLLEYELAPRAERETEIVALLRKSSSPGNG
jgi:nucleoid DNA-binding protein